MTSEERTEAVDRQPTQANPSPAPPPPLHIRPVTSSAPGLSPEAGLTLLPKESPNTAELAAALEAEDTDSTPAVDAFKPCDFFFYGSLMDPDVFQRVTGSPEAPRMQSGWIRGFQMKMWDIYPTLIPEPQYPLACRCHGAHPTARPRIPGVFTRIEDEAIFRALQRYETSAYKASPCTINTDARGVGTPGMTFIWAGHPLSGELKDGSFDLTAYQRDFKPLMF